MHSLDRTYWWRCSNRKQHCRLGIGWGTPEMYPYWAPMTLYYAIADSLNCLTGAIIGSAVLIALQKSGIRVTAIDRLHAKLNSKLR